MTSMTIECESFRATPIGEGRVRLEISEPARPRQAVYGAEEAVARLSEVFGKPVKKHCLAYWRKQGLPFTKLGEKKFLYAEEDISRWAQGRLGHAL